MYIFITVAFYGVKWPTLVDAYFLLYEIVGSYVGSSPIGGIDCFPRQSKL